MLRSLGNLLFRDTGGLKDSQKTKLSKEDAEKLKLYSDKVDALLHSKNQADFHQFPKVVDDFGPTFEGFDEKYRKNSDVRAVISAYSGLCAKIGVEYVDKIEISTKMFNTLVFASKFFPSIPHATEFLPMFSHIIQMLKMKSDFLQHCEKFLQCIFRSESFFTQFNDKDGFYMIFDTFFLKKDYEELQNFFNILLYCSLPLTFLQKSQQSSTFLKSFVQVIKEQKETDFPYKNAILYVLNYFSSFCKSNPDFYQLFQTTGGYELCNEIFLKHCPNTAMEAYELLLIGCDVHPTILSALFDFYKNPEVSPELRSSLIPLLSVSTKSIQDTYKKLETAVPLQNWILEPPGLNYEGLCKLADFFCDLATKKIMNVSNLVPNFITMVAPPVNKDVPVDKFLKLLNIGIINGDITSDFLIKQLFIERFIFLPSISDVYTYFVEFSDFQAISEFVYLSIDTDTIHESMLEKLVGEHSKLSTLESFCNFLDAIFEKHFSPKAIELFPDFMQSELLMNVLIKHIRKNSMSFEIFTNQNGFSKLQSLINSDSSKAKFVIMLLSSLAHFRPYEAIDTWINKQSKDSPIFQVDKEVLFKLATDEKLTLLHLPSLYLYCPQFKCKTPLNLYLAGKYGFQLYKKQGIKFDKIPNLTQIVNRLVTSQTKDDLFNYPEIFHKFVDRTSPYFSIFEFVPFHGPSYMTIQHPSCSISFWFNVPYQISSNLTVFKTNLISIVFSAESVIIETNRNDKIALPCSSNVFHHVVVQFKLSPIKKINKIGFTLDSNNFKDFVVNLEDLPSQIILGETEKHLEASMYISKSLFMSESGFSQLQIELLNKRGPGNLVPIQGVKTAMFNHNESVFDVPFHGFSSYFKDFHQLEMIFELFDTAKNADHLSSIFICLLNIQQRNSIKLRKFWSRMSICFIRQKELVAHNFMYYFFDNFSVIAGEKNTTKILLFLLTFIDFYFTFDSNLIVKWLERILQSKLVNWEFFEQNNLFDFIYNICRANLAEQIIDTFIPFLNKMMLINPNGIKLKSYMNFIVTLRSFEGSESSQYKLIKSFVKLANDNIENQLFTYQQLLDYMSLFKGESSLMLADLICSYSNRNPQFITSSSYACFIFSKFALSENAWLTAFSILGGFVVKKFPKNMSIQRPLFAPVILEMLCSLLNSNSNLDLLQKIIASLLSFNNFQCFTTKNCWPILLCLSNLGVIPTTFSSNKAGTRTELTKENNTYQITREDANNTLELCEFEVPADLNMSEYAMSESGFPRYSGDFDWMETVLNETQIAIFLVSILLSFDSQSFQTTFLEYSAGFALMTINYRRLFSRQMVLNMLIQLANAESSYSMMFKPAILITHHYTVRSLFAEKITDLLSLLFNFLKTLQVNEIFLSFMEDNQVLSCYREILLCAFVFTSEENMIDLFQLFSSFDTVIFCNIVFKDTQFCHYWLCATRQISSTNNKFLKCMKLFMDLVGTSTISSYKQNEIESNWGAFKQHMLQGENELENKLRIERMTTVLDFDSHKKSLAAKHILCQKVFIDIEREQHSKVFNVLMNRIERQIERDYFDCLQRSFRRKLQINVPKESSRLSPLVLPVFQPRVVVPSPFKLPQPKFNVTTPSSFFKLEINIPKNNCHVFETLGILDADPEYFHFQLGKYSCFEYSKYLESDLLQMFTQTFSDIFAPEQLFGTFSVKFYYYIHGLSSVLFVTENALLILTLAEYNDNRLSLIKTLKNPVAFIPFSESVLVGDYQNVSLFCGHVVIILPYDQIIMTRKHLFVHKQSGFSIYSLTSPNVVLDFGHEKEMTIFSKIFQKRNCNFKNFLPHNKFLFCIQTQQQAQSLWQDNKLDNYEYLLVLNYFGGRNFFDLTQYPVFPWICSPNLSERDLSKPMGQLGEERSKHYQLTYDLSEEPKYFYGFHYSLPGIIFWFMVRLCPFCYFGWDLNNGWDDPSRMFLNILDAYNSASQNNQSDLKELIPEVFTIPEIYKNTAKLPFQGLVCDNVLLPEWANNDPQLFTSEMMKKLLENENICEWIDLIFGFKQQGEAALESKNLFLPTSYHNATAESLNMEENVFESQTINFGQCPLQLFTKQHPKHVFNSPTAKEWCSRAKMTKIEPNNPSKLRSFRVTQNETIIPFLSAIFMNYFVSVERESESLIVHDLNNGSAILAAHSPDFSFVTHLSVSPDYLFLVISYNFGRSEVMMIKYDSGVPVELKPIGSITTQEKIHMTAISPRDLVCASLSTSSVIIWSFITSQIHKIIPFYGRFVIYGSGLFSIGGGEQVIDLSVNGEIINTFKSSGDVTCASCIELGRDYTRRIVVVGTVNGAIDFYCGEFLLRQKCGKQAITSVDVFGTSVIAIDTRCQVFKVLLDESFGRCVECGTLTDKRCYQCQKPLCAEHGSICKECNERLTANTQIPQIG
ncbi:Beige/BEACH domain containing protein [Trichomonas vaginalis G3]|uniref:Beige/BEACH domain containing protein n=1 Tax=Trichomonas vaginalis (strain ATCC PRA-98 / G3) TaxID=412133 RepID=A2F2P9_TRIV3|nr:platelet formation protein family [Trichomonas vaginalis G3]EAY00823.1 Beige/BEACH domain containing protein [Trichomonas vaginalis G3]KAI5492097.1 platelet formation protein family [Trichomonas vaginalis G3]|eukprot:XP_001313752.1 Beige/BEACH domain containing protein [Trichomonas vaginalis G3]